MVTEKQYFEKNLFPNRYCRVGFGAGSGHICLDPDPNALFGQIFPDLDPTARAWTITVLLYSNFKEYFFQP